MARIALVLVAALGVAQGVYVNLQNSPRQLFLQRVAPGFQIPQPTDFSNLLSAPFPARQAITGLG